MTPFFSALTVLFASTAAMAHNHEATYYTGQQTVGIVGDKEKCYVEATYSEDGNAVIVRALVADPHDSATLVGQGAISADYNTAQSGYLFKAIDPDAAITEMLLTAPTKKTAEGMGITFFDEGHYDSVTCDALQEAKSSELIDVHEMFEHFDEYIESEDNHGDENHHDHNH